MQKGSKRIVWRDRGHTLWQSLAHVAELLEQRQLCTQCRSVRHHFQQREAHTPRAPRKHHACCAHLAAWLGRQAEAGLCPAAGGGGKWQLLQSRRLFLQQLLEGQRKRL